MFMNFSPHMQNPCKGVPSGGEKNAPDATSFGSTYAPSLRWRGGPHQVIGHIPGLCIVAGHKYCGFVPLKCPPS